MAAFHLIHHSCHALEPVAASLDAGFRRQGFIGPAVLATPMWRLSFFRRPEEPAPLHVSDALGNAGFGAGTLFYGSAFGTEALSRLLADGRAGRIDDDALWGSFAVILAIGDVATVFGGRAGTLHLYGAQDEAIVATSFLALAESLPNPTVDADAVYDYVLQGAPYGGGTPLREIRLLDPGQRLVFGRTVERRAAPPIRPSEQRPPDLDSAARQGLAILRARIGTVAAAFGPRIDMALSGGYDSRLLLALLREAGITPRLYVYGPAQSPDVVVAKAIAAGEGIALEHRDKAEPPDADPDALPDAVARNLLAFDGWSCDGIVDFGTDLRTRLERCAGGRLAINGGGGEILRDFFHLPDRPLDAAALVASFFCQFDPAGCADGFDEKRYVGHLAQALLATLGRPGPRLSRLDAEAAYPLFRCRYWMGRNNTLNNRLGPALTPYVEPALIAASLSVPLRWKVHGRLQARMIELVDPRLAGYRSAYGHAFDEPPPLAFRLRELALRHTPPGLRRYRHRMRRHGAAGLPPALRPQALHRLLGPGFDYLGRFFRVEAIRDRDPGAYNRLCTLEYLFRHLGASLDCRPGRDTRGPDCPTGERLDVPASVLRPAPAGRPPRDGIAGESHVSHR